MGCLNCTFTVWGQLEVWIYFFYSKKHPRLLLDTLVLKNTPQTGEKILATFHTSNLKCATLPEPNIASENWYLEDNRLLLGLGLFSGAICQFQGGDLRRVSWPDSRWPAPVMKLWPLWPLWNFNTSNAKKWWELGEYGIYGSPSSMVSIPTSKLTEKKCEHWHFVKFRGIFGKKKTCGSSDSHCGSSRFKWLFDISWCTLSSVKLVKIGLFVEHSCIYPFQQNVIYNKVVGSEIKSLTSRHGEYSMFS